MDEAALGEVLTKIYTSRGGNPHEATPAISAEQLMYGAHGEKIVSHLLGRYKWHDLLIATRLASL